MFKKIVGLALIISFIAMGVSQFRNNMLDAIYFGIFIMIIFLVHVYHELSKIMSNMDNRIQNYFQSSFKSFYAKTETDAVNPFLIRLKIEKEYYDNQRKEAVQRDLQIKSWILEGLCVHSLGANSKDCQFCQNIINN